MDVTLVKKNEVGTRIEESDGLPRTYLKEGAALSAVELDRVPGRGRDELITRIDSLVENGRFG